MNIVGDGNIFGPDITVSCPQCGGSARVFAGTFNFRRDDIIDIISASAWTREKLAEYQNALN
jgi:hypothetical protein